MDLKAGKRFSDTNGKVGLMDKGFVWNRQKFYYLRTLGYPVVIEGIQLLAALKSRRAGLVRKEKVCFIPDAATERGGHGSCPRAGIPAPSATFLSWLLLEGDEGCPGGHWSQPHRSWLLSSRLGLRWKWHLALSSFCTAEQALIHVFIVAAGLSPLAVPCPHLPLIFFILLCTVAKLTQ